MGIPKIIDAFSYNGELDILDFRLRLLYSEVDFFLIVEADSTHSGHSKNYFFANEFKEHFAWASNKIVYCPVKLPQPPLAENLNDFDAYQFGWQIENLQRNSISSTPFLNDFDPQDLVIVSDVDEIPSLESIELARSFAPQELPRVCNQLLFYYDLNFVRDEVWCGSIFSTVEILKNWSAQTLRDHRNVLPHLETLGGWHLSYFGNVKKKLEDNAHQENNLEKFKDSYYIEQCRKNGWDLFGRPIESRSFDLTTMPEYFQTHINKYNWYSN